MTRIRSKLGGLILAGSTAIVKAFAHTLHQLLTLESWDQGGTRPLDRAISAARAGDKKLVEQIIFEALRFNPVFYFVQRYCPRDTVLALNTSREKEVPAGTIVIVPLVSGMNDDTAVSQAENFVCPRSPHKYLHFGGGEHRCLGVRTATIELVEMFIPLLKHANFESAKPAKKFVYDGPAVHSFLIQLPLRNDKGGAA